jgi:hypothetical protein
VNGIYVHIKFNGPSNKFIFRATYGNFIIIIIIMISDRAEAEACYARAIGIGSA